MANETAKKTLKTRIKLKRDMSANWEKANPVLLNGETIIVDTANNETRTKTGDGTKTYTQLPFDDEGTKGGKGLSTCDYTAEDKAEVAKVKSKVNTSDVLTKTNATEFTPTADYQPATKKYVDDLASNKGGDMMKAVYDHDASGTVDDSDKLGGQLPSYYAKASDLTNKVDKATGKGLSTNDYTNAEKAEVAKIKDKVDKVAGKGLSANDYTDVEKAEVAKVKDKVDKVSGKGLSTNDFTSTYKTKLDNLDSSLSAKAPAYSYSTTDLTAGTSALATGKLYFVYE